MNSWREIAALGRWASIRLNQIETEGDRSDLRWALNEILPREISKVGFRDRETMPQEIPALLLHIQRGNYEKAMQRVRKELAPDAVLDSIEKGQKDRAAKRLLESYIAQGYLTGSSNAETAWQLDQLRHAYLTFHDLEASTAEMFPPSDDWLCRSLEFAHSALKESIVHWPDDIDTVSLTFENLKGIFVKPTQTKSSSIINEAETTWLVKQLPDLRDVAPKQPVEDEEPVFGSEIEKAVKKKHTKNENHLLMDGWSRLSTLAQPDHEYFEFALGQAVSILRCAEEADMKMSLIKRPGRYRPSKTTIIEHMHEMAAIAFEIGRHVQALKTSEFVKTVRLAEMQQARLASKNPNRKGSTKPDNLKVLTFMHNHMSKQIESGKKINVSEAAQAATRKWPNRTVEANRQLYYDKRKLADK